MILGTQHFARYVLAFSAGMVSGGAKCCRDGIGIHQAGRMRFCVFRRSQVTGQPCIQPCRFNQVHILIHTQTYCIWLYGSLIHITYISVVYCDYINVYFTWSNASGRMMVLGFSMGPYCARMGGPLMVSWGQWTWKLLSRP